jgi:uncharacterized protein (TIGR02391 family)
VTSDATSTTGHWCHLEHRDAGRQLTRSRCSCGWTSEWLYSPTRAPEAGLDHSAAAKSVCSCRIAAPGTKYEHAPGTAPAPCAATAPRPGGCGLSVAAKLRGRCGVQGDGAGLVDATCSISSGPRLAFNTLATEWERSEQTGIAMLLKGMFSTFRNTTAHAPRLAWATSRSDAIDMLTLASMLHRRLDAAVVK